NKSFSAFLNQSSWLRNRYYDPNFGNYHEKSQGQTPSSELRTQVIGASAHPLLLNLVQCLNKKAILKRIND
ncbi:MAG TPA: hypothetical protein DD000_24730, partial [Cyanobacteria bacterium UBA11166]|nr:hypothetical protein [Cyanobacteria bacterium UBA11166]